MRATISFEADVTRGNDIMRSLVLEESNALQEALMSLERATADRIVEGISEALVHIHGVANQLEQYRDMVVSFERARFETMLPQESGQVVHNLGELREAVEDMKNFDSFLSQVETQEEAEEDESEEG